MLRLCSLGSGSERQCARRRGGDGLHVKPRPGRQRLFNLRQLERRLAARRPRTARPRCVFVTHEHSRSRRRGQRCALKHWHAGLLLGGHRVPHADFDALGVAWCRCEHGVLSKIGALRIEPYAVPHDAAEPMQFVFADGVRRAGLLTDAGEPTKRSSPRSAGLDALMLECNHDAAHVAARRLSAVSEGAHRRRARPPVERPGRRNRCARVDARALRGSRPRTCRPQTTRPELAQIALAAALDASPHEVAVADQEVGLAWRTRMNRKGPAMPALCLRIDRRLTSSCRPRRRPSSGPVTALTTEQSSCQPGPELRLALERQHLP